ncbi:MAG: hypothetical protein LBU32_19825 [Clostridiales bacterium]|nr:hypothetical protein [Clostridiales bacterium]
MSGTGLIMFNRHDHRIPEAIEVLLRESPANTSWIRTEGGGQRKMLL